MTSTDSGADGGKALSRKVMDIMKEATGASDDDVKAMLQLCNGDVNLATERLVSERPFETVVNKKVKRKQNVEEKGRDQRDSRRSGAAAAARPRPRPEPRVPRGPLPSLPKSTAAQIPPPRSYEPKPAAETWGAASTAATAATDGWGAPQEDAGTTQDSWAAPEPSTSTPTPAPGWGAKPAAAPAAGTGWGAPAPAAAAASSSWTGNFADRLKAGTAKPVAPPEPEPLPEEDLDEPPPIEEDTSAYSLPPPEPLEEEPYAAPSEPEPAPASPPPPAIASPPPAQERNPWESVPSPAPASPPLVSTPAPITPQPVDAPTPSLTPPASTDDLRLTFGNFSLGGQSNDFHSAFPGAFGTVSAPQQAARQVNDLLGSRAAEEPKATYEYPAVTDAQVPQPAPQDHRATFAPQPPAPTRPVPTPSYPYTAVASHAPEPAAPAPQQQPSPQQMSGFHRFDLKTFAQAQQQQQPAATDYTRPYKASNDSFGAGFGPGADQSGFGAAPAASNNGYGSLSSSDAHSAPSAPPAPAVTVPDYTANMTAAAAPRYHQPAPPPAPVAPPPVQQQQQQQVQQQVQQQQQQQPPAPPAASAPPTSYTAASEPSGAPSSLPAVPGMMLPQQMQYGNPTIPANMQYPNMQYQYPQYYHPTHSYMHYNPYSHYSQVGQAYPQGAAGFPPAAAANTTYTNPAQHAAAPRNFTLPFNAAPTSGAATTTSQGYAAQAYGQPAHQGFGMSTSGYEAASGYSKEKEQQNQYQQAAAATSAAAAAAAAAAGAAAAPGAAAASAPSYPNQSRDYYAGGGGQQQQQQHGNYGGQHGSVPYQYQQHYGSHGYQHSSGQGGQGGRQPSNYK